MKKRPILVYCSLLFSGLLMFAAFPEVSGTRKLASCIEEPAANFPLDSQLFSHIQDEALKKSALQYYTFLTQVEMNALQGLESARSIYGLPAMTVGASTNLYAAPTISNFSLQSTPVYQGGWGVLPGMQVPPASNSIALLPRSNLSFGH